MKNICICTERLELKSLAIEHAEAVVALRNDENVFKYFKSPHRITIEEHVNWYKNRYLSDDTRFDFVVVLKGTEEVIGTCGVTDFDAMKSSAEVSYMLAPEYQGRGFAKEAVKGLMSYCVECFGIRRFCAIVHKENKASVRFIENLKFSYADEEGDFVRYQWGRKYKIGIRADANDKIGMGHLMRCISIALRLKELGQEVLFIMSQSYGDDFLADKGFKYVSLNNDYDDKLNEVDDLLGVVLDNHIDRLLVDSYQADGLYLSELKNNGLKLMYMDDMLLERYPVDTLVNYTIGIEEGGYDKIDYDGVKLLLGSDYIPLRPEFGEEPIEIKDSVENVFITTGGTDEFGMVASLAETLSSEAFRHLKKTIVVGKFFKDDERIAELAAEYGNITFHKDVKDICRIMKNCDVAISAGGTTLAELSACGIPTICFSIADNQLGGVKAYEDNKVMYYAGDVRENKWNVIAFIRARLMKMMYEKDLREGFSREARKYVDGRGAVRIAKAIVKM